jgi:type VI protein secretion system component Hcp
LLPASPGSKWINSSAQSPRKIEDPSMPGRFNFPFWLFCLALAALASPSAQAQSIYLCLGSDSTHLTLAQFRHCDPNDSSTPSSLSFGASEPVNTNPTGSSASAPPAVMQLTLTKPVDAISVKLAASLLSQKFDELGSTLVIGMIVPVTMNKTGRGNITIILSDPTVTSLSIGGGSVGNDLPTEVVTFRFKKIVINDYTTVPATVSTWSVSPGGA